MDNMYLDGQYLKNNPQWGAEVCPWKAAQIVQLIRPVIHVFQTN